MRELKFSGTLDLYSGVDFCNTGPFIAGRDVIGEIMDIWSWGHEPHDVKVFLGVEPIAEGRLWAIHGFGGTDVTPPESPEITVGGIEIIPKLWDLDGREILLIIQGE